MLATPREPLTLRVPCTASVCIQVRVASEPTLSTMRTLPEATPVPQKLLTVPAKPPALTNSTVPVLPVLPKFTIFPEATVRSSLR